MLIGGNFSAEFTGTKSKSGSTTTTLYHTNSITLGPQVGYFIINNVAAGAVLDIQSSSTKYEGSSDKISGTSVLFSPFGRYYLQQGIFFQGRFDVGSRKIKQETGSTTTTTTYGLSGGSISAGYALFLADNVALEPQIGYGTIAQKLKSNGVKSIESGLFIRVGFQIYLKK